MNLIRFFILRPVFSSVVSFILIVLGLFFFTKLPVLNMPEYFKPELTISSYIDGADPEYIEKEIVSLIEKNIKNIKNLESYTSSSRMGGCNVELIFNEKADIEIALNDTRSAISALAGRLPENMQLPSVSKVGSNDRQSIWIAISSSKLTDLELGKISIDQIKPLIERLPAAGAVAIRGLRYNTLLITLDSLSLFKYKLSPYEVEEKIKSCSKNFPLGDAYFYNAIYSFKMNNATKDLENLKNLILSKPFNSEIIRLKDVADVKFSPSRLDSIWHCDKNRCLGLAITKASSSNSILLSKQVKEVIHHLSNSLSDLVDFSVVYDDSLGLIESIKSVAKTIFEAIVLVSIIIFIFLGSIKLSLVPILTIPISIIGTFFIMDLLNFSINMFTLLAISLSIGMVVDDAIVILENINRHMKVLGKSKLDATIDATTEISSAVIAMTITLAAVFIPVGFMEGEQGKQFTEFAWTLAACVGVSGIVALTLSPMLTLKFISNAPKEIKSLLIVEKCLEKLENFYVCILEKTLNRKIVPLLSSIFVILGTFFAFKKIEKALLPNEDIGLLLIDYQFPDGWNVFECEKTVEKVENFLSEYEEINHYMTPIWHGGAFTFLTLKDWKLRKKSQHKIMRELNVKFQNIIESSVFCFNPMGGGTKKSGLQLNFTLKSTQEYGNLDTAVNLLINNIKNKNLSRSIHSNFSRSQPTIKITPNKTMMHLYNVDLQNVASSIQYLSSDRKVCDLWMNGDSYNVIMNYKNNSQNLISNINKIIVKSNKNELIPLTNLVKVEVTGEISVYHHHNGFKAITVHMALNENVELVDAMNEVKKSFLQTLDPTNFSLEFEGDAKKIGETESNMAITFLFSLLLIFLVLAAQFESFKDSLMILVSVPFATVGGIIGLWVFSETMNLYSYIGFIALIGLVTKNAIMIVEFANQLLEHGNNTSEAIIEASRIRLRPILMTAISTILGAVPLIISSGAGAGANHSLGMVIVFGMTFGTIFTLIIIPLLYHSFKKGL